MVNGQLQCVANKSQDAKPRFVDGNGNPLDFAAGNRPGYRISTSDARQNLVDQAYSRYDALVSTAYKLHDDEVQCAECFGSGQGPDGDDCDACNGSGVMPDPNAGAGGTLFGSTNEGGEDDDDDSTSDSIKHRQNMDRLYAARDAELSNAWRNKG